MRCSHLGERQVMSVRPIAAGSEKGVPYWAARGLPSIKETRFSTRTGAWAEMAAAVLEVGRLDPSPRLKTLGNDVC